jgi:hypothetical protein
MGASGQIGQNRSNRPCENFLYYFKAAPQGRSRRRHGAQAVALAAAPLRPGRCRSAGAKGGFPGAAEDQAVTGPRRI